MLITVGGRPSAPPASERKFLTTYVNRYGPAQPYAILGYAAISLMLGAISRGTDDGTQPAYRSRVLAALMRTRDQRSVLGTYSIEPDGNTTLRRYGVYRVLDGQLGFWKAISG